jgi:hypothetical protein
MKKIFALAGVASLLAACSTAEYGGADYTSDANYRTGSGTSTGVVDRDASGNITEEGPGMHTETRTGVTGPGTTGATNQFDGGTRP